MVRLHEEALVFPVFSEETAWELGTRMRAAALQAGVSVFLDVTIGDHSVFRSAMSGTAPANADWARRKHNLVSMLHVSSYHAYLQTALGMDMIELMALDRRDHVAAGGCFPIRVAGVGIIGTATVSGLPMRDDHALVVNTIADMLGIDLGDARFA